MEEWLVILICFGFCAVVCGIIEGIKQIIKCIATKNSKTIDFSKYEYLLSGFAIVCTFGVIVAFLYFGKFIPEYNLTDILKLASVIASSTQTIYLFIIQTIRKGLSGILSALEKIIANLNSNKTTAEKVDGIIEVASSNETKTEETLKDFIKNLTK